MQIRDITINKTFSKDQIKELGRLTTKEMKWNNDTIKLLKIHFAAGPTGYQTLQEWQIPLPGLKTLQRKMQCIKSQPGVLSEVFDCPKLKLNGLTEHERET